MSLLDLPGNTDLLARFLSLHQLAATALLIVQRDQLGSPWYSLPLVLSRLHHWLLHWGWMLTQLYASRVLPNLVWT